MLDNISLIKKLKMLSRLVLIEDGDLTSDILFRHLSNHVDIPLSVYSFSKHLKLKTNSFFGISENDFNIPEIGEKNMAKIIRQQRKSSVLRRPTLPCLSQYHTINLFAGCPYKCRYCYARSFRSYNNNGYIILYSNTYELLKNELNKKRRKPVCVYFSTAC